VGVDTWDLLLLMSVFLVYECILMGKCGSLGGLGVWVVGWVDVCGLWSTSVEYYT
jgi:hypothetical protein